MSPCLHPKQSDLTQGIGSNGPHLYCPDCKWHHYKGRDWTREEWHVYINEELTGAPSWPTETSNAQTADAVSRFPGSIHPALHIGNRFEPCYFCRHLEYDLVEPICHGPELPKGSLKHDDGTCEQWEPKLKSPV